MQMTRNPDASNGASDTTGIEIKAPTISRAGSFISTVSFVHADDFKDFAVRQEAVLHPVSNRWLIQEVWLRPNVLSAEPTHVEDYQPVKDKLGRPLALSLSDAIAHLATFEHSNRRMGQKPYGETAEDLGHKHVEAFAAMNGFALDITNKPHMTLNGRIVTKGFFAPDTRVKVMDYYNREAIEPEKSPETALAMIFRNSSTVENFDRLIANKIDLSRWNKFVTRMGKVVEALCQIQNSNYKEDEKSRFGGMVTVNYVKYEEDYRDAIKEARNALSAVTFFTADQKKERFERMLDEIHLVYEVAYAKALYAKLNRSDEPEKHQEELSKKVKDAARHCRTVLGGTETDIQRMQSEIIENNPRFCIASDEKKRPAMYTLFRKHEIGTSHDLYFMPDQVGEILKALDNTTAELEKVIADEKKRIQNVTPESVALEARKANSNNPAGSAGGPR